MKKLILLSSLVFCAVSAHAQSNPALFRCKDQSRVIELSVNNTGQTVEGPACVEITVNALRYGAEFGKTVTSSAGPNLTSVFPSSFAPGGAEPKAITAPSLEEKFQADEQIRLMLSAQLILVESKNRTTSSNLDKYLTTLKSLIAQTDDTLATSGASGVLAVVNHPTVKTQMDAILGSVVNWNTTDEIVTRLQQLQADLTSLPLQFPSNTGPVAGDPCSSTNIKLLGWSDWSAKCRDAQYKLAQSTIASLLTEAAPWTSDGDKAAQFAKKIGIVQYWKTVIMGLQAESFKKQAEVRCGVLFNRNEQTVLKLILTDRTSVFDGQAPQPQTKDNLLTVTCSSPFSISAGAAFSTIHNQQFTIVKSAPSAGGTTSVNTFGVTSDSRINPYPIALAHARLHDWDENRYALHFSFGVGVSVKGQDSGGSNPEFMTGLSFSFLRTIYVTCGLDVGKQSQLIGGFKVGGTVPSDVTSPPVSSSYKPGFGFAITFTKP
jgi:hypothetical protein